MANLLSTTITGNLTVDTNVLYVDSTNNRVGIGTTSPTTSLDVNGTISSGGSPIAWFSDNYNRIYRPNGTVGIYLGNSSDEGNYYDNTTHYFRSAAGGTNRMIINSSGNVLIGTTTDSGNKLEVNGSIRGTSIIKNGGTSWQYLKADGSVTTVNSSTDFVRYGDFVNYPTFAGKTVTMHPSVIKTLLWGGQNIRYTVTDSYTGTYPQAGSTWVRTFELIDGSNSVYSSGNIYCGFWNNYPPANITVRVQTTSGTWHGPYQGSNIGVGYFEYWRIPCGGPNFIKAWEITFTPQAGLGVNLITTDIVIDNNEGIDQDPFVSRGGSSIYGTLSFKGTGSATTAYINNSGVIGGLYLRPSNNGGLLYFQNSGGNTAGMMFMDGSIWRFKSQNSADTFNIFANGNLGIKQTTDAGYTVDINGTTRHNGATTINNRYLYHQGDSAIQYYMTSNAWSGNNTIFFGDDSSSTIGSISYSHQFDSLSFNVNGSNALFINSSRNVGIGTTSPTEKLHVSGAAIFDGGAGDSSTDAVVYITKSNNNDWGLYVNASGLDYGMYARVSPSAGYAIGVNNGTNWTTRFTGNGRLYLNEKDTIASFDTWLRLNESGHYGSGVYTPGVMRADGGFNVSGSTVWHAGNDGSGSGLDADLLDGVDSSRFVYGNSGTRRGTNLISNWNQADHPDVAFLSAENGGSNAPSSDYSYGMQYSFHRSGAAYRTQFVTSLYSDLDIWVRNSRDSDVWTSWKRLWHSNDFSSTNISNWNTAYGWGNHASAGYLTSGSLSGYATQSYVTSAISALVDSAPAALDTLNELAAALGDDANFSTTITNSIASKQAQLNGTGFVKVSGTTVSYDNSTYLTSYTETDTLDTVTGRGATTTNAITTGTHTIYGTNTTSAESVLLQFTASGDTLGSIRTYNAGAYNQHTRFYTSNVVGTTETLAFMYDHNGNVGIGTTSPAQKLHVVGNTITTGVAYTDIVQTWLGTSIDFRHQDASVVMRVDTANARVGIGTTSPAFKTTISADITKSGDVNPGTAQLSLEGATTPGKRMILGYDTNSNGFGFIKAGNYGVTWTALSLQPDGGNVGIGTTSPSSKLQVTGGDIFIDYDKRIGGGTAYNSVWNRINLYNGGIGDMEITMHNTNWYLRHNANATFAGNVGIGTTSPTFKLEVTADASINGVRIGKGAGNIASNTIVGYEAGLANNGGTETVAVGYQALRSYTTASKNTVVGHQAAYAVTTGNENTAMGYASMNVTTTGVWNTAIGSLSLFYNNTGNANTAVGKSSLYNTTSSNNTAVGWQAGFANTSGILTAFGYSALRNSTTAYDNTAIGYSAMYENTTGGENTAVGKEALKYVSTGSANTGMGVLALFSNNGSRNTGFGYRAGANNLTGTDNVFLGHRAGENETGSNKLYISNSSTSNLIYGDFSTKYLGFGTTSPGAYMHIKYSSSSIAGLLIENDGVGYNAGSLTLRSGTSGGMNMSVTPGGGMYWYSLSNSSNALTLSSSNNLIINGAVDNGKKLQVNGDVFIKGSGSASSTRIFEVQNSNGTSIMDFRGDAYAFFGCGQGGGDASGFIFRYNDTSHVQFTGYNYGNGAGSYKPILLDTDLVGRSQGVYVNFGGTGYANPAPLGSTEFAVRGRTSDATQNVMELRDSNNTEKFVVKNDGAIVTNGAMGWTGTVSFPSNPPGQQNLQFTNGILTNVF